MAKAYGYVRTARPNPEQVREQKAAIRAAVDRLGIDAGFIYVEEGVSGHTPPADRPVLAGLLEVLHDGDVLIVADAARLGRDAVQILELLDVLRSRRITLILDARQVAGLL